MGKWSKFYREYKPKQPKKALLNADERKYLFGHKSVHESLDAQFNQKTRKISFREWMQRPI